MTFAFPFPSFNIFHPSPLLINQLTIVIASLLNTQISITFLFVSKTYPNPGLVTGPATRTWTHSHFSPPVNLRNCILLLDNPLLLSPHRGG